MAANQTSNQRSRSVKQPARAVRRAIQPVEEESNDYSSMGEMAEHATDYVRRSASHVGEYAREHKGAIAIVALAAGLGIGLVAAQAFGFPRRQPRGWRDRAMAEGIGRRMLNRLEGMIPDVLAEHFSK